LGGTGAVLQNLLHSNRLKHSVVEPEPESQGGISYFLAGDKEGLIGKKKSLETVHLTNLLYRMFILGTQ
jgi:hypothetical protein